eukprot:1158467-Pelagomonas_calceolata.AAC.9
MEHPLEPQVPNVNQVPLGSGCPTDFTVWHACKRHTRMQQQQQQHPPLVSCSASELGVLVPLVEVMEATEMLRSLAAIRRKALASSLSSRPALSAACTHVHMRVRVCMRKERKLYKGRGNSPDINSGHPTVFDSYQLGCPAHINAQQLLGNWLESGHHAAFEEYLLPISSTYTQLYK